MLWIDYFWERDTTRRVKKRVKAELWIDYFWERDTTVRQCGVISKCCGLITFGNEIQPHKGKKTVLLVVD